MTHFSPPFFVVRMMPRAPVMTTRERSFTYSPYRVVLVGLSCSSHSNPPFCVDSTTPFEPTAHPCCLSELKRRQLMLFPCGSGFCHCQPRSGSCAATDRLKL